jgi:hypothetical protein
MTDDVFECGFGGTTALELFAARVTGVCEPTTGEVRVTPKAGAIGLASIATVTATIAMQRARIFDPPKLTMHLRSGTRFIPP